MTDIDWRPTDGYDAFGVMQRGTPPDFFRAELAGGGAVHVDPSIATFVVVPRTLEFAACAAETGVTRDQVVRWRREALLRDVRQIPDAYRGSVIVYPRGTCAQIRAAKADDFYQRLIIHRNVIKAELDDASEVDKPALKSDEQGIKILANATSYGIFVELNVEDYVTAKPMIGHGGRSEVPSLQVQRVREAWRIFSSAARHADHWRCAIDAGECAHTQWSWTPSNRLADRFGRRDHLHQHGPHFTLGRDARI